MRSRFTLEHRGATFAALSITTSIVPGALIDTRWYWLALIAGIHLW